MLSRCSGEFMYAWNNVSAEEVGPSPTFSPYAVQSGLPWVSSWWPRFGLCDRACCSSRWFVQFAATVEVPLVTVTALSPWSARAELMSETSRLANAEGEDSAPAEGASSAVRPSRTPTASAAADRRRIGPPGLVDYALITRLD